MPVVEVVKDTDTHTLTIVAEFAAPVERIWALYADPRQLEQVWGPPEYPATFVDHELAVGHRSTYFMTSPEGQKFAGWWRITDVQEPTSFSFDDGFADEEFHEVSHLPVSHCEYRFADAGGRTRATFHSRYESADALAKVLEMGMEEGATTAINQIDAFLAGSG